MVQKPPGEPNRLRAALDRQLCRLVDSGRLPGDDPGLAPVASALIAADLARRLPETGDLVPTEGGMARARRALARKAGLADHAWLAQHASLRSGPVDTTGGPPVLLDDRESPLAWLRRRTDRQGRPLIDDASYAAGERFRADIERAALRPRVTANWTPGPRGPARAGSGPEDVTLVALSARRRIEAALDAVGPDLGGLLIDVCGFVKGLELVEAERNWPARSAKVVLVVALRRLAAHYGLANEARGPAASAGIRLWRSADEPAPLA